MTSIYVAINDPPENPDIVTVKFSAPIVGKSWSLLIHMSEYKDKYKKQVTQFDTKGQDTIF